MRNTIPQSFFSLTIPILLQALFFLSGCDAQDVAGDVKEDDGDGPAVTESSIRPAIKRFSSCEELGEIIEPVIYGRPPDMATFRVDDVGDKQGFQCKWSYDRGDDPVPGSTLVNKDDTTTQTSYITPDLILQLDKQRRSVSDPRLEQQAYGHVFLTRAEHITGGDIGTLEFKLYAWQSEEREGEAEVVSIVVRFPFPMENPPPIPGDGQVTDMLLAMMAAEH